MNQFSDITEHELHAYVDNQLTHERRMEVEDYLKKHPEMAEWVVDYQQLNSSINILYGPNREEKKQGSNNNIISHKTVAKKRIRQKLYKIAASISWLMIGSAIGWSSHYSIGGDQGINDEKYVHLVQPASFAHTVFSTETQHPVEVSFQQQEHLVAWLSNRLHTKIKAPDLSDNNFQLIGGRLLPSTNRMAAQFMYERKDHVRVTLYIRRGSWSSDNVTFQYTEQGSSSVLYWTDGEMGYALVGGINKKVLLDLSEQVFGQLI